MTDFPTLSHTSTSEIPILSLRGQDEPPDLSWSAVLHELYNEVFPESVLILGMSVLYQLICMACGCKGPGVEFKVRLMFVVMQQPFL